MKMTHAIVPPLVLKSWSRTCKTIANLAGRNLKRKRRKFKQKTKLNVKWSNNRVRLKCNLSLIITDLALTVSNNVVNSQVAAALKDKSNALIRSSNRFISKNLMTREVRTVREVVTTHLETRACKKATRSLKFRSALSTKPRSAQPAIITSMATLKK